MRDYVLNQAMSQGEYGLVSFLRRTGAELEGQAPDYSAFPILTITCCAISVSPVTKCNGPPACR